MPRPDAHCTLPSPINPFHLIASSPVRPELGHSGLCSIDFPACGPSACQDVPLTDVPLLLSRCRWKCMQCSIELESLRQRIVPVSAGELLSFSVNQPSEALRKADLSGCLTVPSLCTDGVQICVQCLQNMMGYSTQAIIRGCPGPAICIE